MKLTDASKMAKEMITKYVPGCEFAGFNRRKRALGTATLKNGKEYIELSQVYVSGASEENVKNTIAHECAHILAWRTYGTFKHDKYFYKCCKITGAEQTRVCKDKKVTEMMKGGYGLVLIEDEKVKEVINSTWHSRPRRDMSECYLTNRPKYETKGKLFYCLVQDAVVGKTKTVGKYWQK